MPLQTGSDVYKIHVYSSLEPAVGGKGKILASSLSMNANVVYIFKYFCILFAFNTAYSNGTIINIFSYYGLAKKKDPFYMDVWMGSIPAQYKHTKSFFL
jgi:hypothetical protein